MAPRSACQHMSAQCAKVCLGGCKHGWVLQSHWPCLQQSFSPKYSLLNDSFHYHYLIPLKYCLLLQLRKEGCIAILFVGAGALHMPSKTVFLSKNRVSGNHVRDCLTELKDVFYHFFESVLVESIVTRFQTHRWYTKQRSWYDIRMCEHSFRCLD